MCQHLKVHPTLFLLPVLCITVLIYFKSLAGNFTLDDFHNIVHNPNLVIDEVSPEALTAVVALNWESHPRPLAKLGFALNLYYFGIDSAFSFKLINLIIHCINGILIFFVCKFLLAFITQSENRLTPTQSLLPFLVCTIWLIHPIQVSAVAYVVQRMTNLSTLFTLLGILLYLKARLLMIEKKSAKSILFIYIPLVFLLSLANKEIGILLFCFLFLIECSSDHIKTLHRSTVLVLFHSLFFLLPCILILLFMVFNFHLISDNYQWRDFTLEQRLLTQPRVILLYLQMLLFPYAPEFSIYHDDFPVSQSLMTPGSTLVAIAALISLLIAATVMLFTRRFKLVGFGLLFFFIGHLVESTILSLEMVFEHRNYLPSLGIFIAVLALITMLPVPDRLRYATLSIWLSYIGFSGFLHASLWQDNTLHTLNMVEHHPDSFRAHFASANVYLPFAKTIDSPYTVQALTHIDKAKALNQFSIVPHVLHMIMLYQTRQTIKPVILQNMIKRLQNAPITPDSSNALFKMSQNLPETERIMSLEQLQTIIETALNNPKNTNKRIQSTLYFALFHIHFHRKDQKNALSTIQSGLAHQPRAYQFRVIIIDILLNAGEKEKAKKHFNTLASSPYKFINQRVLEKLKRRINAVEQSEQTDKKQVSFIEI